MKILRYIPAFIAALLCTGVASAVTDAEMEQARTIAAQLYLRYANNGSGYLDELHPKTMQELEKGLKAKEKENIKAFKSIKVPSDYAAWDKSKLVEYWSVTAFNTSGLLAEGKGARSRVKARINSMSVSAPQEKPVKEEHRVADTQAEQAAAAPDAPAADVPQQEDPALEKAALEADSIAAEESLRAEPVKKEDSSTWIYVAILCILVAVVIALVIYATKTLKDGGKASASRSPAPEEDASSTSDRELEEMREKFGRTLAARNEELEHLRQKAESASRRADELERRLHECETELEEARASLRQQAARQSVAAEQAPVAAERRVIYLGRVNARGIFVRAARRFNPANDIYVLETTDGITGSYYVATDPTVADTALLSPRESLGGGCDGDFRRADTASSIVTDMRGEAVFEDGCWRVARKARISFA